jgi:hypothetical protein
MLNRYTHDCKAERGYGENHVNERSLLTRYEVMDLSRKNGTSPAKTMEPIPYGQIKVVCEKAMY